MTFYTVLYIPKGFSNTKQKNLAIKWIVYPNIFNRTSVKTKKRKNILINSAHVMYSTAYKCYYLE